MFDFTFTADIYTSKGLSIYRYTKKNKMFSCISVSNTRTYTIVSI